MPPTVEMITNLSGVSVGEHGIPCRASRPSKLDESNTLQQRQGGRKFRSIFALLGGTDSFVGELCRAGIVAARIYMSA